MKFGSLFSGIGGFDLAFERAGMTCAWQCEIDQKAGAVLARHWPDVKNFGDVRNVKSGSVEPVDLICGGFPCQDLSVAGKRAGLAGERSGLWFEYHRILSELRPRWVVIENVPGLLSSNRGRDFAVLLSGLAEIGYLSAWRILDAQYFGVAQRRRRVFVVASLGDGRAAEVLFEREGVSWNPPARREAGKGTPAVSGTLAASGGGTDRPAGNGNELDSCISGTLDGGSCSNKRGGQSNELDFIISASVASKWAKGTGSPAGDEAQNLVAWQDHGGERFDISRGVSSTLRSEDHGRPPLYGVRRLTPTECERLQGFPDGWTDGQADSVRYKQTGNAVAVPVAEWIGRRIVGVNHV